MKQWLDRITGRFTMYRTVLVLLIAISAIAVVLSLFGQLSFTPLELLVSYAVAIGTTLLAGLLFAALFRTKAHLESSAITGILLFIVLTPTLEPDRLAAIAIAGLLATASKYLLAWRGRHIFNPAAMGAFIVTAFQLTGSGWWVGTPYLLPVVAIGAFIVLYRTRHLAMGITFLLAVAVLAPLVSLSLGFDPLQGLNTVVFSSGAVFLAGFMLSEPLTLPPRRWQQLLIAVVVAALFAVPFNIFAVVYSSPQLALVIGNLVAFFFGQRRGIRLALVSKTQLTPTTWEFTFQPARPVRFAAGQYMELAVPHAKADARGTRRYFSISSAPAPDAPITFALKVGPRERAEETSSFKRALLELAPGDTVHGTLVGGDFMLPADLEVPLLLVAGGIGITPFASQLADASTQGRDVVVAYAVSDPTELAYSSLLASSGARVIVTAPTKPPKLPKGWTYAGARLTQEVIEKEIPDAASRRAFVSGPPSLVNDVRVTLRRLGSKRVTTDYFSGY